MLKKTIAMYIRLSLEDGDINNNGKKESNSIVNQRSLLQEFIKSDAELSQYEIKEFCDDGYSGTNFHRPAFQKMMQEVKKQEIQCIIVKDLSRFGREYLDVSSYLERIFPVFGIRFISVNDYFDSNDYIGTTGGMELAFRNLINAMYSKDLSVKTKSARKTRAKRGEYVGGHPFYGYLKDPSDKHHLIVDENVRHIIERIYDMCIEGYSTMAISKILNDEKIPCPAEYKRQKGIRYNKPTLEKKSFWIQSTVRSILKDQRYTGKMVSNRFQSAGIGQNTFIQNDAKDWIIVDGTHEAIISEEIFIRANEALSSRVKTINKNTSWKRSGNLFVCGYCGRKLQKSTEKEVHLYCLKSKYEENVECCNIYEGLEELEQAVFLSLKKMEQILTNSLVIARKKKENEENLLRKEIELLQKRKQRIVSDKSRLYERYKNGDISREQYITLQNSRKEETESLERKFDMLKQKIREIEEDQASVDFKNEIKNIGALKEYDPKVIGRMVEKILVFEHGRIELIMKNQDAYNRVLTQ